MATPTLKFYPNRTKISKKDGLIPIYFRIIYQTKKIEGKLPLVLNDTECKMWTKDYLNPESKLNLNLSKYRLRFAEYLEKTSEHNFNLESIKSAVLGLSYESNLVKQFSIKTYFDNYFNDFVTADSLKTEGTKKNYEKAFNKIYSFLEKENLNDTLIHNTPKTFGVEFSNYLKSRIQNTISQNEQPIKPLASSTAHGYLKKVKSVFIQALNEGEINYNPFFKVKIVPNSKTKEKLSIFQIRDLMRLNLKNKPTLEKYRNCFIIQFFTGCAFTDTCQITDKNFAEAIQNHIRLSGKRLKTSEIYEQVCSKHFLEMVDFMRLKYNLKDSIVPKLELTSYNESLTIIGELAHINFKLSSHYARLAFHQAIIDSNVNDEKAEYRMMGWSRKNEIDYRYGRVTDEKLLDATKLLETFFDKHLLNPKSGKMYLFD